MSLELVVGAPVWDRGWCLDIWFDSVCANVTPSKTGLVFVVPPEDQRTRDVIERRGAEFAFVEVVRDRAPAHDRRERLEDNHATLARARNALLKEVQQVGPKWYLSWDSDLLIAPRVLAKLKSSGKPVTTVWTWLNRMQPRRGRHWDDERSQLLEVVWQEPVAATAMEWEAERRAHHFPSNEFGERAAGLWRCDVALAFQLMAPAAYARASYAPHPHGEDIPFNWQLKELGVDRWCYGGQPGVHLFNREQSIEEIRVGYPQVMKLAEQRPLAVTYEGERSPEYTTIGLFPLLDESRAQG